jgi:hypothetical protein
LQKVVLVKSYHTVDFTENFCVYIKRRTMKKLMLVLLTCSGQLFAARLAPVANSGYYAAVDAGNIQGAVNAFNSNQVSGKQLKSNALAYLYANLDINALSPADQAKVSAMIGSTPADFSANLSITASNRKWLQAMNPAHAANTRPVAAPAGRMPAPAPVPGPVAAPVMGGDDAGIPDAPPAPEPDEPAAKVKAERDVKHVGPRPAPVEPGRRVPSSRELEDARAKLKRAKEDKAKDDAAGRGGLMDELRRKQKEREARPAAPAPAPRPAAPAPVRREGGELISPELRDKLAKQREAVAGEEESEAGSENPWE